jgi:protein-tyrosine phosphatase
MNNYKINKPPFFHVASFTAQSVPTPTQNGSGSNPSSVGDLSTSQARVVSLPSIYQYLYLANYAYVSQPASVLQNTGIDYIINLSGKPLNTSIQADSIPFSDSKNEPINVFLTSIDQVIDKLNWCIQNQLHVVVNCSAGVDRSVASVIAYAMKYSGNNSPNYWLQYIENCKNQQGYSDWKSLNNAIFLQYLNMLQNNTTPTAVLPSGT